MHQHNLDQEYVKALQLGSMYFQNIGIKDIILTMKLSNYVLNMKSNSNKDHE